MHLLDFTETAILIDTVPYPKGHIIVDEEDWNNDLITLKTMWDYRTPVIQRAPYDDLSSPDGVFSNIDEAKEYIIDNYFNAAGSGTPLPVLDTPTAVAAVAHDGVVNVTCYFVANAGEYEAQACTNSAFTGTVFSGSAALQDVPIAGLTNGIDYYYRIRAKATGYTRSAWANGTGTVAPVAQPTLATPVNLDGSGHNMRIDVSCDAVPNAATYEAQIATDAGFTTDVHSGTSSLPMVHVAGATNGTAYHYRIRAVAPGYTSSAWLTSVGTVVAVNLNVGLGVTGFIGDSITAGTGSNVGYSYPEQLNTLLDAAKYDKVLHNWGSAGSRSDNWLGWIRYRILANYNPGSSRNILTIMLGVNDKTYGLTQTQFRNNMTWLCQTARHNGWKVLLLAPTVAYHVPTDPAVTTGFEFDFATWAAANQATLGYHGFASMATNANVGQCLTSNAAYWVMDNGSTDHVHYGTVGYAEFASAIIPLVDVLEGIESLIPGLPTTTENTGARTITVTPAPGTTYADYEYTLNNGWDYAPMLSAVLTLDATVAYQPGQVGIRRAVNGNNACSGWKYNTNTFTVSNAGLTAEYVGVADVRWSYAAGGLGWIAYTNGYIGTTVGVKFLQSGGYQESNTPASISFTKGIKVVQESAVDNATEVYVDDVLVATYRGATPGVTIYEAYPGTTSTKTLKIKAGMSTAWLVGATLYS